MNTKLELILGTLVIAGGVATTGCGDDSTATTSATTATTQAGCGSGGAGGAGCGAGGAGCGAGGAGCGAAEVHGCTYATATDMKGNAEVSAADGGEWVIGYNACIIVDTGTKVTWTGNFTLHPLDGGVSPDADAGSPISAAGEGLSGDATAEATLADAGEYPFFCGVHVGTMQGVIYVE